MNFPAQNLRPARVASANGLRLIVFAAVIGCGLAGGARAAEPVEREVPWEKPPEFKNRVGVSLSLGFNASATFSRLAPVLLPPPPPDVHLIDRRYDDGFVLRDAYADG